MCSSSPPPAEQSPSRSPDPWLRGLGPLFSRGIPGPALDVACGNGRNAFWLARLGIDVVGVDRSATAIREAAGHSEERGSSVRFQVWDLEADGLPSGPWGAVIVFHYLDRALLPSLASILADGGLLAYKTHLAHPLRGSQTHPRRADYLLRPAELLHAFPSLTALDYREWATPGHAYAAFLARKASPHSR